ncbi:cytochrome b [Pseudogemmobacter sonorensis]|uniref:cytochrome b n=1 Tax=Pseudogemmobacter sonorensis TaxID=2989681 RepID=UPI00369DAE23
MTTSQAKSPRTRPAGYGPAQIALHWLIALGIVVNYFAGSGMGRALFQRLQGAEVTVPNAMLHVWLGVAVFVLAVIRIILRLRRGAPPAPHGITGKLAHAVHGLLYLLILLMPLAGMVAWFGGQEAAAGPHMLMANLILLLAAGHALAALFHQFVLKDGTLLRMLRPG